MYLKGTYYKTIFLNTSNNYIVGLLKVKENDYDTEYNNKTITFTGYLTGINIDDNLKLTGNFTNHNKYGTQFNVTSYEVILPEEKEGIVSFLSSDLFKGIGEGKAKKIYDKFKSDTISIILNSPNRLKEIKGLSKKDINTLSEKLLEYKESSDTIVKLNDLGFNNRDSTNLYNKYKDKTLDIINNNIYDVIDNNFSYSKIDSIALKNKYDFLDIRRIKASIIYVINEVCFSLGHTYLLYNEIYSYLIRCLSFNIDFSLYEECMNSLINEEKIVVNHDKYYLKRMFDSENYIAKRFTYLNNKKMDNEKEIYKIYNEIKKYSSINYNIKQENAIIKAVSSNFLIITGGPGTGKTTIIKAIIRMYQELFKKKNKDIEKEVALLAPTGRAAKKLMETVSFKASTIHSFLKWNKDNDTFSVNEYAKACKSVVIIDESSMIDTYLMDSLLKGLYYDTKIILVGDYNQLPSVGPGEILKDLITSGYFLTIKLDELYRQKENSNIISFAYNINNNIYDDNVFNGNDVKLIETDSINLYDEFVNICNLYKDYNYNDLVILAPMYKTKCGIDNLNIIARDIFNPKNYQNEILIGDTLYREGDKVIELINMPDDNVYNGDIGIIESINTITKELIINYDGNIVNYNSSNYYNFKLGYVISIHKSQGSEYKVVIVIMLNEYKRMLYRKLLYTAVTRCREKLYVIGEREAIKKSINNDNIYLRNTTLINQIEEIYKIKV